MISRLVLLFLCVLSGGTDVSYASERPKKKFTCRCTKTYNSKKSLSEHIRIIKRGYLYSCEFCHKRYTKQARSKYCCRDGQGNNKCPYCKLTTFKVYFCFDGAYNKVYNRSISFENPNELIRHITQNHFKRISSARDYVWIPIGDDPKKWDPATHGNPESLSHSTRSSYSAPSDTSSSSFQSFAQETAELLAKIDQRWGSPNNPNNQSSDLNSDYDDFGVLINTQWDKIGWPSFTLSDRDRLMGIPQEEKD